MRLVTLGYYTLHVIDSKIVRWEVPESNINTDTKRVELRYDPTCALLHLI